MTTTDQILALVRKKPGLTESDLALALFPEAPYQQRVNSACRWLVKEGRMQRSGLGGAGDPYRYRVRGRD